VPSAADITNAKTDQAHHNDREPRDILMPFSKPRQELVDRLDVLCCEDSLRRAHQPRLNVPMRLMDRAILSLNTTTTILPTSGKCSGLNR